jgi:UPF0716 protein FxsA
MVKWLVAAGLLIYTLLEIGLLVEVTRRVGLAWMLAWTIGSAVGGIWLLRVEGIRGILRIHRSLQQEVLPTRELIDMAMIVLGALMLVAPGILSDAAGLLLLIPPTRWALRELLLKGLGRLSASQRQPVAPSREVIDVQPEQVGK